jgi:hypothetical protein
MAKPAPFAGTEQVLLTERLRVPLVGICRGLDKDKGLDERID